MSVNPIDVKALKAGEYYWLYAPGVMGEDDPLIVGEYSVNGSKQGTWFLGGGELYTAGPGITPISHIKKPTWKPK